MTGNRRVDHFDQQDELFDELVKELYALRLILDEVVEHYTINVKAAIGEIIRVLEKKRISGENKVTTMPGKGELQMMVLSLQKLKVKPKKGRGKDLKKIQALVRNIASIFPEN